MKKFIYGKGSNSTFTALEVLQALELGEEYIATIGNGLSIGGLNITAEDQSIRFSEGTDKLVIIAPELDPVEVDCDFDDSEEIEENSPEVDGEAVAETPTE